MKEYETREDVYNKKRLHSSIGYKPPIEFENEVFSRFNKLRELKGIMQIQKREHLGIAIRRILESIRWFEK